MKTISKTIIIYAVLGLSIFACKSPIEVYEQSGHDISLERSKKLYDNYNSNIKDAVEQRQKKLLKRTEEYKGTEFVVLSIQQLEHYLRFLKSVENKNKSNENNKITGIAVFIGAYNDDEKLENLPKFNANIRNYEEMNQPNTGYDGDIRQRMTVFLAPTYRNDDKNIRTEFERQTPFYIQANNAKKPYSGEYKDLWLLLKKGTSPKASRSDSSTNDSSTNTSLNANEFHSMPPKPKP